MGPLRAAAEISPALERGQSTGAGCPPSATSRSAVLQWKSPEENSLVEEGKGGEMYLCHVLFYLVLNMNKQLLYAS